VGVGKDFDFGELVELGCLGCDQSGFGGGVGALD